MIKKLWNGDYSLCNTFWYGGIVNGIFARMIRKASTYETIKVIYICGLIYAVMWWVGVWRAADKYTGNQIWATLAKIAVVFGIACNVYYLYLFM